LSAEGTILRTRIKYKGNQRGKSEKRTGKRIKARSGRVSGKRKKECYNINQQKKMTTRCRGMRLPWRSGHAMKQEREKGKRNAMGLVFGEENNVKGKSIVK